MMTRSNLPSTHAPEPLTLLTGHQDFVFPQRRKLSVGFGAGLEVALERLVLGSIWLGLDAIDGLSTNASAGFGSSTFGGAFGSRSSESASKSSLLGAEGGVSCRFHVPSAIAWPAGARRVDDLGAALTTKVTVALPCAMFELPSVLVSLEKIQARVRGARTSGLLRHSKASLIPQ